MDQQDIANLKSAGKIAAQVREYARTFIKKEMLLLEIAEHLEKKMCELGAKPAFPVNLSINEIAAHATPSFDDAQKASGLLKVDIGVHINGCIADTAFSIDLENNEEHKKLIAAAEQALKQAASIVKENIFLNEIGKAIETEIKNSGFIPIQNLSGHSIEKYKLHAGITIPNYNNAQKKPLAVGVYAIEPFATTGFGSVRDGKKSGIYAIQKEGNVRDAFARHVLAFIKKEYLTLPFCSRWLQKQFSSKALIALRRIEEAGLTHHYSQLIEVNNGKVAQAEHTIIITEKEAIITTN